MRFAPIQLATNQSMTASFTTPGVDLNQAVLYSIQASWSGTPVGTFQLQISDDNVPVAAATGNPVGSDPAANVVNWSTYTGSATTVNGAGNFLWNVFDVGYRWVRLQYIAGSSTGTCNSTFSGKSI